MTQTAFYVAKMQDKTPFVYVLCLCSAVGARHCERNYYIVIPRERNDRGNLVGTKLTQVDCQHSFPSQEIAALALAMTVRDIAHESAHNQADNFAKLWQDFTLSCFDSKNSRRGSKCEDKCGFRH